ncbi:MAG TPA: IPT/TIG domain-containing protein [Thermoanaerobaculia bacterium]|jgi:hypothetical protein
MLQHFRAAAAVVLVCLAVPAFAAGTFTVTNTNDSGTGSLRKALSDANAAGGGTVTFAIGSGQQTITPLTIYAPLTTSVVIDGRTQPGYSGTPLVEVDGALIANAGWSYGFSLPTADIRGLAFTNFPSHAVQIGHGSVKGCYFGLDPTGTQAKPNLYGILTFTDGPLAIGGAAAGDGNVFVSTGGGMYIEYASSVTIDGNIFGANPAMTRTFATGTGLYIWSSKNLIIGSLKPNVFLGTGMTAIELDYSKDSTVSGNYFGVTPDGRRFGLSGGMQIYMTSDVLVQFNAFTQSRNWAAMQLTGNTLRAKLLGNTIEQSYFGIDLDKCCYTGLPTANDPGDSDTGPNNLINYPELTRVVSLDGITHVEGTLSTHPNRAHLVQFFASAECGSGASQAERFIGSANVTTDASGAATFTADFAQEPTGTFITATATTDLEGTSELSPCVAAQGRGTFSFEEPYVLGDEGGNAEVVVQRTNGTVGAVSVGYTAVAGTAAAGDYGVASGTLNFADGESEKTILVPLVADGIYEDVQRFELQLTNPSSGTSLGSVRSVTISIADHDPMPFFSAEPAIAVTEGNSGAKDVALTFHLTAAAETQVTSQWVEVYGGTAWYGEDFTTASPMQLTFPPGATTATLTLSIVGDTAYEPDEDVIIRVYGAFNSVLSTVAILNDDERPKLLLSDVTIREDERKAVLTLTATAPMPNGIYVTTENGSAVAGRDYTPWSQFVWLFYEKSLTIEIPITNDAEPEPDESFIVRATPAGPSSEMVVAHVTIANDDVGIGPAERDIAAGESGGFVIALGSAPQADAVIELSSRDPRAVSVPATLTVGRGENTASFEAKALVAGATVPIDIALPPSLGGAALVVQVNTYETAALTFAPQFLSTSIGRTASVRATLTPANSEAVTVALTADGATAPASFVIAPGGSGSFDVTASRKGPITIVATLPSRYGNRTSALLGTATDAPSEPTLFGVSPVSGPTAGGTDVDVRGVHFTSDCTVRFGGVAATVRFASAELLHATTGAHAAGTVDVALSCGAKQSTLPDAFTYLSAGPHLSSVSPSSSSMSGGSVVKIAGQNLDSGCWFYFDGKSAAAVAFRDAQSADVVTPPHASGNVDVSMRCRGGVDTLARAFTYLTEEDPLPLVTSVAPLAVSPGETLTLGGLYFRPSDDVNIDAADADVLSTTPTEQRVVVPELPPGPGSIIVTRSPFRASTTTGPAVTILDPLRPRVTAIAPQSSAAGAELELTGEGFREALGFTVGGQRAAVVSLSWTRAVVRIPAALQVGSYDVSVVNANGSVAANGPRVTIAAGGVVVRSVSPRCATTDGGDVVTIAGSGFGPGATVTFDGVAATDVVVVDGTTIQARVPAGTAGFTRVVVTSGAGAGTLTQSFRYLSPFDPRGCASPKTRSVRH